MLARRAAIDFERPSSGCSCPFHMGISSTDIGRAERPDLELRFLPSVGLRTLLLELGLRSFQDVGLVTSVSSMLLSLDIREAIPTGSAMLSLPVALILGIFSSVWVLMLRAAIEGGRIGTWFNHPPPMFSPASQVIDRWTSTVSSRSNVPNGSRGSHRKFSTNRV